MLKFDRILTGPDRDPYTMFEWEDDTVTVLNKDGETIFASTTASFPKNWSKNARKIVAQKYFRTSHKTGERENSVAAMVERVTKQISSAGVNQGYFTPTECINFEAELAYILLSQKASFNSPIYFNLGVPGNDHPQVAACFLNEVTDDMRSILDLCMIEGMIFKEGSGSGVNFSKLRGSREIIKGGGQASGPCSFMQGYDAFANIILSGGRVRRAARMCILDIDHPDIVDFINCKAEQEDIVEILVKAGIPADFTKEKNAYTIVKHQSANNSVRVPDKFMEAVRKAVYYHEESDWQLTNRVDGKVSETLPVAELFHKMAEAAWKCGDPGLQFGDTINRMNTCKNDGEIVTSNPCLSGRMRLQTDQAWAPIPIAELAGKTFNLISPVTDQLVPSSAWCSGVKPLYAIKLADGTTIECTEDHVFRLTDYTHCPARNLIGKKLMPYTGKYGPKSPSLHRDTTVVAITYIGDENVYDFSEPESHWGIVGDVWVHNCSEVFFLNNTACNLGALNLCKFLKDDGSFNVKTFKHVVRTMLVAQDILVDLGHYPTKKITKNSHQYRPLGLGYANLGGLLMTLGIPYDSDKGRDIAASITSLMTGQAYLTSIEMAEHLEPFERFIPNRSAMMPVLEQHASRTRDLKKDVLDLAPAAFAVWRDVIGIGFGRKKSIEGGGPGFRNSQVTLLQPTGTTALMMDCSTTGIEPDIGLKKIKTMVGGETMSWINDTIEPALVHLGYTVKERESLMRYVNTHGHFEGSTLLDEHLPVFDCALPVGNRQIAVDGHILMVAAVQPFLSGAVSKTFNMPTDATVEDVEHAFLKAWERGLKSITIYRSGSKLSEPLRVKEVITKAKESAVLVRRKMPDAIPATRTKFNVGGHEGFLHPGFDPDTGELIEIFIRMAKAGSTVYGLLDSYAILFSKALQYGIPLEALVKDMAGSKFEPAGFTQHPEIHSASSILDFIAKWIQFNGWVDGSTPVPAEDVFRESVPPPPPGIDTLNESPCPHCGQLLRRAGTCCFCTNCTYSSGVCG